MPISDMVSLSAQVPVAASCRGGASAISLTLDVYSHVATHIPAEAENLSARCWK